MNYCKRIIHLYINVMDENMALPKITTLEIMKIFWLCRVKMPSHTIVSYFRKVKTSDSSPKLVHCNAHHLFNNANHQGSTKWMNLNSLGLMPYKSFNRSRKWQLSITMYSTTTTLFWWLAIAWWIKHMAQENTDFTRKKFSIVLL